MVDLEGTAWALRVLGDEGPYIRAILPRVLSETHSRYAATQGALGLTSAEPYGLMWLGVPQALVEEFDGVASVQMHRPRHGRYRLPVINGVPLIPWRYAKDKTTDLDRVPFGQPVSASKKSLFEDISLPLELDLGEAGRGNAIIDRLSPQDREELDAYGKEVAALTADRRLVSVLAYASNPDALLSCHFGYARLRSNGLLDWAFREQLALAPTRGRSLRTSAAVDGRPAFDSGTPQKHALRPRSPLAGAPTGEPIGTPASTATDE